MQHSYNSATLNTLLCSDVTVGQFLEYRASGNRNAMVDTLRKRLTERFLKSVVSHSYGGSMYLVVSCLLIETLEAFRQGLKNTYGHSGACFKSFLGRSARFKHLHGHEEEFYSAIRCGLMHQGETTYGWRITQRQASGSNPNAPILYDVESKKIDARLFLRYVREEMEEYCRLLKVTPATSPEWQGFLTKMEAVCDSCEPRKWSARVRSVRGSSKKSAIKKKALTRKSP